MEVYKSTQPLKDETTGKYFYPPICVDQIYPVGSIYLSVNNTNPASLFGGTWEQLQDRFLLGAGGSYNAGVTGGEATHTLTVNEMPRHIHTVHNTVSAGNNADYAKVSAGGNVDTGVTTWRTGNTNGVGDSQPHNNMPPYLAVYMWKRIS